LAIEVPRMRVTVAVLASPLCARKAPRALAPLLDVALMTVELRVFAPQRHPRLLMHGRSEHMGRERRATMTGRTLLAAPQRIQELPSMWIFVATPAIPLLTTWMTLAISHRVRPVASIARKSRVRFLEPKAGMRMLLPREPRVAERTRVFPMATHTRPSRLGTHAAGKGLDEQRGMRTLMAVLTDPRFRGAILSMRLQ